jgi:hypothetical protein
MSRANLNLYIQRQILYDSNDYPIAFTAMAFAALPAIADLFEVSFQPAIVDLVEVVQLVLGDLVKVEFQPALSDLLEVEFQPALGDVVEVEFGLRP